MKHEIEALHLVIDQKFIYAEQDVQSATQSYNINVFIKTSLTVTKMYATLVLRRKQTL